MDPFYILNRTIHPFSKLNEFFVESQHSWSLSQPPLGQPGASWAGRQSITGLKLNLFFFFFIFNYSGFFVCFFSSGPKVLNSTKEKKLKLIWRDDLENKIWKKKKIKRGRDGGYRVQINKTVDAYRKKHQNRQ